MHALILSSSTDTHSPEEPLKTAEEVLREIDDIMQVISEQQNVIKTAATREAINIFFLSHHRCRKVRQWKDRRIQRVPC